MQEYFGSKRELDETIFWNQHDLYSFRELAFVHFHLSLNAKSTWTGIRDKEMESVVHKTSATFLTEQFGVTKHSSIQWHFSAILHRAHLPVLNFAKMYSRKSDMKWMKHFAQWALLFSCQCTFQKLLSRCQRHRQLVTNQCRWKTLYNCHHLCLFLGVNQLPKSTWTTVRTRAGGLQPLGHYKYQVWLMVIRKLSLWCRAKHEM